MLILDGDTFLFKCLYAVDGYYYQLRALNFSIERVLGKFPLFSYELILGGRDNFRKKLSPTYKSNRTQRPPNLHDAKQYLVKYWKAEIAKGEADDEIAARQTNGSIVVSNDKDMLQLGGQIYNPWKDELVIIDNPEYYFWRQMLVGDATDSIKGCLNPKKLHHSKPPCFTNDTAGELLEGLSKEEMKEIVQTQYKIVYGEAWHSRYDLTARLLWLVRDPNKNYYDYF